jgi:hypothetical protein
MFMISQKHCVRVNDEDVVFVDVAGGIREQCALLKQELPEVKGRVILQDLEMVIQHSIPSKGWRRVLLICGRVSLLEVILLSSLSLPPLSA